mmetsp:Transcript_242/g.796  ORF Transcript_242/g.796 Transcript_242/m.796 type:complete len:102 (-) Transcript_242:61-366(-)
MLYKRFNQSVALCPKSRPSPRNWTPFRTILGSLQMSLRAWEVSTSLGARSTPCIQLLYGPLRRCYGLLRSARSSGQPLRLCVRVTATVDGANRWQLHVLVG